MIVRRARFALAALLMLLAGCGSGGDDAGPTAAGTLDIAATDELAFDPAAMEATAGTVTVRLTAGPGVEHTLVIAGLHGDQPIVSADPGTTAEGTVELAAGSYTFYCSVPGHRAAGMEGTVDVT